MDLSLTIRSKVREIQNGLSLATDEEHVLMLLNQGKVLLTGMKPSELGIEVDEQMSSVKEEFRKNHYVRFCEFILQDSSINWLKFLGEDGMTKWFDLFFLSEVTLQDSFILLCSSLSRVNHTIILRNIVHALVEFISGDKFGDLLFEKCQSVNDQQRGLVVPEIWNSLITFIMSVPERVANKLQLATSSLFHPDNYFQKLGYQMGQTLEKIHNKLILSQNCSVTFLSQLLGKIGTTGHTAAVFSTLLPLLETWTFSSPLWCRICTYFINEISDRSLEPITECLLKKISNPVLFSKLFADGILTNQKLKFLLTHKFLLVRHYEQLNILQNIISYFCGCKRRFLLSATLKKLLQVWGDASAIRHISYEQHLYITKAVLLCLGQMTEEETQTNKEELLTQLLTGIQSHLDCPVEIIRKVGMVTAECFTQCLKPDGTQLKFDYETDSELEMLKSLVKMPNKKYDQDLKTSKIENATKHLCLKEDNDNEPSRVNEVSDGDESDDNLEPYDLEDEKDEPIGKVHPPKHLRDCLDGLLSSNDPDRHEASLFALEKLVLDRQSDLQDVWMEVIKILLHLQDQYSTMNFTQIRHKSMVAVTVRCPEEVACYLTTEFYAPNYSLGQRMDILEVLAAAAQQLSDPTCEINPTPKSSCFSSLQQMSNLPEKIPDWQRIIKERVEMKTKRYSKGPSKVQAVPVENRFGPVAGNFFFPLLKNYDSKVNTFDLLGGDSFVLGKLVYCLGVMIYAAVHSPVARNMTSALLEFIWIIRFHKEAYVRQACLFALAMLVISAPPNALCIDLQTEVMECRNWLEITVKNDPNQECRKLGVQTLILLEQTVSKELGVQANELL